MIASGIIKNDNQQLNMHEDGTIIPRGRVLCKRIEDKSCIQLSKFQHCHGWNES
jgi:hypothetical protein